MLDFIFYIGAFWLVCCTIAVGIFLGCLISPAFKAEIIADLKK